MKKLFLILILAFSLVNASEISNLINKAEQGDMEAQFELATAYANGERVKQSDEKAAYWYEKSANQGYGIAQLMLASIYNSGTGVKKDPHKALEWIMKYQQPNPNVEKVTETDEFSDFLIKANQGDSDSQMLVALTYYVGKDFGYNVEIDWSKSFYWFKKAAEQGDQIAQNQVAKMYLKGYGTKQNKQKAIYWYEQAAKQGSKKAQEQLKLLTVTEK